MVFDTKDIVMAAVVIGGGYLLLRSAGGILGGLLEKTGSGVESFTGSVATSAGSFIPDLFGSFFGSIKEWGDDSKWFG